MSVLYAMFILIKQEGSMNTSTTPDFLVDFFVNFEEWYFGQPENHVAECTCQGCDPEFHLEMMDDFDWSFEYNEGE